MEQGANTLYVRFRDEDIIRIVLTQDVDHPFRVTAADAAKAEALQGLLTRYPVTGFYAGGSFMTEAEAEADKQKQAGFNPGAAHPMNAGQPQGTAYNSKSVYQLTFRTPAAATQVKEELALLNVVEDARVYDNRIGAVSH